MFNNSYWVSTKYYKPGGPVFLFDAGEGNGADLVPLFTYGAPDIYTDFLREFHGLGIIWEHRCVIAPILHEGNTAVSIC